MESNLIGMINNTVQFLGTSAGILIIILISIAVTEFFVILLLIWIIKNNFKRNNATASQLGDTNGKQTN